MAGLPEDADVVEVVETESEAAALSLPPLLVNETVERFLDDNGIGSGPMMSERIGEGHSNVTYRVTRGDTSVVLRRPPRPPLPPSAHDVLREARVLRGLDGTDVPVPRVLATCESESLLGVPFYVMEYLDGVTLTVDTPPSLAKPACRADLARATVEALAALHAVDYDRRGLGGLGKPEGYLSRQLRRFSSLWEAGRTREFPELDDVTRWLEANMPESGAATIVHGDFRIGNLIFAFAPPARVLGVVDWEMATLGDPLADVGYMCAMYSETGQPANVMTELQPVTREPGFPSARELAALYETLTARSVSGLRWYRVLAIWKSAIFLEQSYRRFLSGNEHDPWFAEMGDGVPELVAHAGREAGLWT